MSRRLCVVFVTFAFAFVSAASGCSSAPSPTPMFRSGAASIHKAPQSLGTWTTKAPMPTARYALAVSVVMRKLYAVGDCNSFGCFGSPLNVVESFSPR
jgi:hypothetical protein